MLDYSEGYHSYYVYIITNKYRSTYYVGMTNNLGLRLQQHKENIKNGVKTFAAKYNLEFLVYYEKFTWVHEAIGREKEIKGWRREKKLNLIRTLNENLEFLDHHFNNQSEIPPPTPSTGRGSDDNSQGILTFTPRF
jgi:putative endonuclease